MPLFNVEEYAEDAINSVLRQSYNDFELILINDGSTDSTEAIAIKFGLNDERIRIINKKNGGASSARNLGIQQASGKYLCFIDSDDTLERDTLLNIHSIIFEHKVEVVAFTAKSFIQNAQNLNNSFDLEKSTKFYSRSYLKEGVYSGLRFYEITSKYQNFVASVCLYVVQRKIIQEHGLQFYEGIMHEDELFSRQLLLFSQNLYFIKRDFYKRRIRPNSVSTSIVTPFNAYSLLKVAEGIDKLNIQYNNTSLSQDILHFYEWTIKSLKSVENRTKDYNQVVKLLYNSHLSKRYRIDFKTTIFLKYKNLHSLIKFLTYVRYKMGIRTRVRRYFIKK